MLNLRPFLQLMAANVDDITRIGFKHSADAFVEQFRLRWSRRQAPRRQVHIISMRLSQIIMLAGDMARTAIEAFDDACFILFVPAVGGAALSVDTTPLTVVED